MKLTKFDRAEPSVTFKTLPLRLELSASRASALARLMLILPAAMAVAVPLGLVASRAVTEPQTLALLAERPLATLQIGLGVGLWAILFVLPAWRALMRLFARRLVEIVDGNVTIRDRGVLADTTSKVALASYLGIAHHIRASLSGTVHEMVLVHPDQRRCVTLLVAERITQRTMDEASALLGVGQVPARALYDRAVRPAAERGKPLPALHPVGA
jgi:hypothetical protein